MFRTIVTLAALGSVLACPDHTPPSALGKRDSTDQRESSAKWTFENQAAWAELFPICASGTMQSPIDLSGPYSKVHAPSFRYDEEAVGTLSNSGYGPSFTLDSTTDAPTFTSTNGTTYYLLGFHTHTLSDHSWNGQRASAELHLVHGDASGAPKGVIGIPLEVGSEESDFFSEILGPEGAPGVTSNLKLDNHEIDVSKAIEESGGFKDYYTYQGSLTTPPCTEGKRWWVSGNSLKVSDEQMSELMSISDISAREVQPIKEHRLGLL